MEDKAQLVVARPSSVKPFTLTDENVSQKKYLGEYKNQDEGFDFVDSDSNVSICGKENFDEDGVGENRAVSEFDAELMNRRISEKYATYDERERVMGGIDAIIRHDMERAASLEAASLESHANFDSNSAILNTETTRMNIPETTVNANAGTAISNMNISGQLGLMRSMALVKLQVRKLK